MKPRFQYFYDLTQKEIEDRYWNFIQKNLDQDLDWFKISSNQNITLSRIRDNPGLPWVWEGISSNPHLTLDFIDEYPDKPWDWYWLSDKLCTKEREMFIEQQIREHLAAFKIQLYWRHANYNPHYELCKRRLLRECEELGIE